ncbi:MAG: trypsin-like peptidase domain-containing protein [Tyzzerella sp.]|nr:trypsin-like peptidase domain-containing protein [Tyzzerella sp.]
MNDENRYEPYQYGKPQEPQFEEPDLDKQEQEHDFEESQFEEPKFEESTPEADPYIPRYDYNYTSQAASPQQPVKQRTGNSVGKLFITVALAIVFGVFASVVFQVSNRVIDNMFGGNKTNNHTGQIVNSTEITTGSGSTVKSDVANVAESVMPSVVSIVNLSVQEVQNFFFGGTTQYESQSSGSGIIIGQNDTELLLVTNNHVVQGSKTLTVTFKDGKSIEAQIKGTDADLDLAILSVPLSSVESSTKETIKVATLGDSDALRVGEPAIAIGNALGYGQSVTAGIVSALNCTIESYEGKLIQTDAAINPGNSGGALLNANGEVIGINTAKVSDEQVEGMGYAIPISDVVDVLNELMNKETRTKVPESARGALGIKGLTVGSDMSQYYNMPEGVYVSEVIKGGGADKAGLPVNSIIIKIDGNSVDSMEELQEELQYYRVGDTVELTIKVQDRSGYVKEKIKVTLGKPQS